MKFIPILALFFCALNAAPNQTDTVDTVLPEDALPFTLQIDTAPFGLPSGLQAYASAVYDNKWIFIAGRTNGLHGFDNVGNNFPISFQNTRVFVVEPETGQSWERSLLLGDLTPKEIDSLSVTASESFQKGHLLYLVGGYGVDTQSGLMGTKSTLTEINLKKLLKWVQGAGSIKSAIRQTSHPLLQVTGGSLYQANDHEPMLLSLGQNFTGLYRDDSNGEYTHQIRRFWIQDDGKNLKIIPHVSNDLKADYRRRDLNVLPIINNNDFHYVAFAGVFTIDVGVWTVPIIIKPDGSSYQPDPNKASTFKQAMNQYNCASFGLYSTKSKEMYAVFPGGISYGYFDSGTFQTDLEFPFINQVTTIKIDKNWNFTQYLMNGEYPFIASTGTNPGNQLLFGAEAVFFPKKGISLYQNGVIQLDKIKEPTVIGYIAGGIMSTLPNTNTREDSTSSPYVFTVTLIPKNPS
jgi:hypothetical protein